jgi:hypothetical protein
MAKEIDITERVRLAVDCVKKFGEGTDSDYGTAIAVIRGAREAIEEARIACIDVADLRSLLPDLEQKARRFYADKAVNRVGQIGKGKPSGYLNPDAAIRDARNAIVDAKNAGADVSDLEFAMPEIERKAWCFAAGKA